MNVLQLHILQGSMAIEFADVWLVMNGFCNRKFILTCERGSAYFFPELWCSVTAECLKFTYQMLYSVIFKTDITHNIKCWWSHVSRALPFVISFNGVIWGTATKWGHFTS